MMVEKRRIGRLGQQLRTEITLLVESTLEDPRIGPITVNQVRLSGDMRHARIYVSATGNEKERSETMTGLNSARKFLRRQLSQRLPHLRKTPELIFSCDSSPEQILRVEELIEGIQ